MKPLVWRIGWCVIKVHAVKRTVDHIADRAAQYQRHAYKEASVSILERHSVEIVPDAEHGTDAEQGERHLTEFALPPDAKSHPRVQQVMQAEPITQNIHLLVYVHIFMNQQFAELIYTNHNQGNQIVLSYFHSFPSNFSH